MYFSNSDSSYIILVVFFYDISYASNDLTVVKKFKERLSISFDVKYYGSLESFIPWTITRTTSLISLFKRQYADLLLHGTSLHNFNTFLEPIESEVDINSSSLDDPLLSNSDHHLYQAFFVGTSYLSTCTRPDLTYTVTSLSRHLHAPLLTHLQQKKRTLCYVRYSLLRNILPCRTDHSIKLFSAVVSDWGGDTSSSRSTTGYIVTINGTPIY